MELLTPDEIERQRTARGWTHRELAARAGRGSSTVFKWETGERPLTVDGHERLMKAFASVMFAPATDLPTGIIEGDRLDTLPVAPDWWAEGAVVCIHDGELVQLGTIRGTRCFRRLGSRDPVLYDNEPVERVVAELHRKQPWLMTPAG